MKYNYEILMMVFLHFKEEGLWFLHVSFPHGAASASLSVCAKVILPLHLLMRQARSSILQI